MQKYRRQNSISRQNHNLSTFSTYNNGVIKRSNKNVKLICILLFLIALLAILTVFNKNNSANALTRSESDAQKNVKQDLLDEIEKSFDNLDFDDLDDFVKQIDKNVGKLFSSNTKELTMKIMKGEFITDFEGFSNYLFSCMGNILSKYIPVFFFIVFISILSGVLEGLTSGFIRKPITDIIKFVCYAAIIIVLFTALNGILTDVKNTVLRVKKLMDITFPILLTLMVAMGGVVSPTLYKPIMLVLSNFIVNVINTVIIPFFIAGIVLSVVGNMSNSIKLTKLPKFFVSVSGWILGTMFSVFSGFLTLRGIGGISVDNVSVNATKFAISSYVPILGGYVSDGFDLVLASCSLIKNSFGITVLIILLFTIISPIIKVIIFMLGLKLVEAVIEPISDNKVTDMLNSVSKNLLTLVSAMVGLAFMFFILTLLIIYTFKFSY